MERGFAVHLHAEERIGRRFDPEFELLSGRDLIRQLEDLLAVVLAEHRAAGEAEIRHSVPEKQRFAVQVDRKRDRFSGPGGRNLGSQAEPAAVPRTAPALPFANRPVFSLEPFRVRNRVGAMPELGLHRHGLEEKLVRKTFVKMACTVQIKIELSLKHGETVLKINNNATGCIAV